MKWLAAVACVTLLAIIGYVFRGRPTQAPAGQDGNEVAAEVRVLPYGLGSATRSTESPEARCPTPPSGSGSSRRGTASR